MGFLDKIKGAVHAVTGGAAKVTLDYEPKVAFPGDTIAVKISATSTGAEVKGMGVFVDLVGVESVRLRRNDAQGVTDDVRVTRETFSQEIQVAPAFQLAPNETQYFEANVQVPGSLQPSYAGHFTQHEWNIRGRLDAFGNDPDSGYLPLRIGLRS
jgi:sporulation-control protein spo0M